MRLQSDVMVDYACSLALKEKFPLKTPKSYVPEVVHTLLFVLDSSNPVPVLYKPSVPPAYTPRMLHPHPEKSVHWPA